MGQILPACGPLRSIGSIGRIPCIRKPEVGAPSRRILGRGRTSPPTVWRPALSGAGSPAARSVVEGGAASVTGIPATGIAGNRSSFQAHLSDKGDGVGRCRMENYFRLCHLAANLAE